MKRHHMLAIVVALMLTACVDTSQRISGSVSNAAIVAAVEGNLPDGVTLETANQKQMDKAVKRVIRANPDTTGSIVAAISEAAPSRAGMANKALSAAVAPFRQSSGHGKH